MDGRVQRRLRRGKLTVKRPSSSVSPRPNRPPPRLTEAFSTASLLPVGVWRITVPRISTLLLFRKVSSSSRHRSLSFCMVSLIGLPPTGGLIAKLYIFNGAIQHGLVWLVVIAVINSVISAFYYLRVVKVMWTGEPASDEKVPSSIALRVALGISCLFVLLLGIIPGSFVGLAQAASKLFTG